MIAYPIQKSEYVTCMLRAIVFIQSTTRNTLETLGQELTYKQLFETIIISESVQGVKTHWHEL